MVKIGIIGGTGLDDPEILKDAEDVDIETKYGKPSSTLKEGKIEGVDVVLLSRHGKQHTLPPTKVNFKANIQALKDRGCTHILSTTAVGSLKEEIDKGHLVVLDQFIDFTKHREYTFYDAFPPNEPKHTPMAEPFSEELRNVLIESCKEQNVNYHEKGTVVTIEGPRFSTKAESFMFRSFGADVINMTIATECSLANEAGLKYGTIAISTDYDCWKESEEQVTWEMVMKIFKENVEKVTNILENTIKKIKND